MKDRFYENASAWAKFNENIRLDLNYETLEIAKEKKDEKPLWIELNDDYKEYYDNPTIELSLEQAEWLAKELIDMIKLIKE